MSRNNTTAALSSLMARYGAAFYDSGARYDEEERPRKKRMFKIALQLDRLSDQDLSTLGDTHDAAMDGNANFPAPVPSAVDYNASLSAFKGKLAEIALLEVQLAGLYLQRDDLRKDFEEKLTARATHVETTHGDDPAKMTTSGLPLQSAPVATTSMPQPQNAVATTGDSAGEVDLSCDAVPKTKVYLWQCRPHEEGQVPGPWVDLKPAGRSSSTATGLTPGAQYAFRVQVLGPNNLESPWSDICICRAA